MTPELAALLVQDLRLIRNRVRIQERQGLIYDWHWPLFSPSPSYLETGTSGPLALSAIESIDIEKAETKHRGALVPPLIIDRACEIESILAKHGLAYESEGSYIRIKP